MLEADQGEVRRKSMALGSLFVQLVAQVGESSIDCSSGHYLYSGCFFKTEL